jgi:hypothetical protein
MYVCMYVCKYDDKPLVLHLATYTPLYFAKDSITTIIKFKKQLTNFKEFRP